MEDVLGVISVLAIMNVDEKTKEIQEEALLCAGASQSRIAKVPQIASGQEVLKALGLVSLNGKTRVRQRVLSMHLGAWVNHRY